nr:MAG TPA: hypothetical protein [Caudoviricetes sp.]
MRKMIQWLRASNRDKHLLGGMVIGLLANTAYCAAYAGIGVASALELKDKLWGGKPDAVDWTMTIVGVALGYGLRMASIYILTGGLV